MSYLERVFPWLTDDGIGERKIRDIQEEREKARSRAAELEAEIARLREENAQLKRDIDSMPNFGGRVENGN